MSYSTRNSINEAQQNNSISQPAAAQFVDNRASTAVQLKQQALMAASPNAIAQRAAISSMNASAVQQQKIIQRMEPEEELQLKAIPQTAQLADMDEEELLQGKFEAAQRAEDEELLQGKFEPAQRAEKPNNTGLPDNLKSGIENLSGMSMDHVKVHYNSDKPAQLQAHAYAQGSEIHIAPGQEKHLPHEAWHVVQQAQGRVKPTVQMKGGGVPVNDDIGLETEADVMGAKALQQISMHKKSEKINFALQSTAQLAAVIQCERWFGVEWKNLKKRKNGTLVFNNKLDALRALKSHFNEVEKTYMKEGDWDSCADKAMDKEYGIDEAYKLATGIVDAGVIQKKAADKRQKIVDDGLMAMVDDIAFGDIAAAAVKKGIDIYPSGAMNTGLGQIYAATDVNDAINELDGCGYLDAAQNVQITDVHKVSDKTGKMSGDRLSPYQANVNMKVYGHKSQVHIDADGLN